MKTVTVIGVGALGSHVVAFLRNEDARLRVIDFDRVEQKNTASQFHGKPSVGKSKVHSLQQTVMLLWGMKLDPIPHKLTKENDEQLLGRSDLLIDCLDNANARCIVQAYARRTHTPCVHGALAAEGTFGRVIWDESFEIDDEGAAGAATCENGDHLPFIAITSSVLAHAAKTFLRAGTKTGYTIHPGGVTPA